MPNPLKPKGAVTFDDPHGFVHDERVYLFACRDASPQNNFFAMNEWWVWSSANLVDWQHESTLRPEDTCIGAPSHQCWATFGLERGGKWFWYFSTPNAIGVVSAESPKGPWHDPIGDWLIPQGLVAESGSRDADVLIDDDGSCYLIFGTFDYFIVRLGDDMISIAEKPRPLTIRSPYGPYGKGKTDDKPSLHKRNGLYYLSWSGFYAVSDNVYGPYEYRGSVIDPRFIERSFLNQDIHQDRHGNFFEFHGQWYYVTNDHSQPGRHKFYRDSVMGIAHYRSNGDIAPVRIDRQGVGHYDAHHAIEAAEYFKASGACVSESSFGGFEVRGLCNGSSLTFQNVHHCPENGTLTLMISSPSGGGKLEIRDRNTDGMILGETEIPATGGWEVFTPVICSLRNVSGTLDLHLTFEGNSMEFCRLHRFFFCDPKLK